MNNFQPLLKSLYENLNIPQPQRSQILLEIAADMQDMYDHLLIKGLSENEALDELENEFSFDEATIDQLKLIHTPNYSRWLENLPISTKNYWEKAIITILAAFMIFVISTVFSSKNFIQDSSPMLYAILPFAAAGIFLICKKYYEIFIKRDHETGSIRKWMQTILLTGIASLGVGILGLISEIYTVFINMAGNIEQSLKYFIDLLLRSSALLTVSMASCLIISVCWYILIKKIQDIEMSEALVLINHE